MPRRSRPQYCSSRKIRYANRREAWRALLSLWTNSGMRSKPVRCYRCPECKAWHLTKLEVWGTGDER